MLGPYYKLSVDQISDISSQNIDDHAPPKITPYMVRCMASNLLALIIKAEAYHTTLTNLGLDPEPLWDMEDEDDDEEDE